MKKQVLHRRRLALLVLAAAAAVVALVPSATAHGSFGDAIISNGVVQLGVHSIANLNVPGPPSAGGTSVVGLRYVPTNNESTAPGCLCEGWGAADAGTRLTGYANESSGTSNVTAVGFTFTPSTAVSVVEIDDEAKTQTMRVTHDYHPSAATPNLYEVTVTIENVGSTDIQDLRYRRVMDWDVEPTPFSEYSTINGRAFPNLLFTSNDGFATANPLGSRSSLGFTGFFTDAGPADHGALFDFGFGALKPGEKTTFNTYYGAAGNESDAVAAVGAVGAEVWSFGQPSTAGNPTSGTPNTFIFAFGSVGGEPFAGRDPRPPLQLDVFAPSEIGPGDSEVFPVRAVLSNVGGADATGVTTRIALGPGLTLDSGDASRSVGTLKPGESREETFNVRAARDCLDRVYTYDVFADYAERPEGESERRVTEMVVVKGTGGCETPDPPRLSIGDASVAEGNGGENAAVFTVTMSRPSSDTVTVEYTADNGTAEVGPDYAPSFGTLTFGPGETSKQVAVNARGDFADEADETFLVLLRNPVNAELADPQGLGTIVDDDDAARQPAPPGAPPADLTVSISSSPSGQVAAGTTVTYTVTVTNNGPGVAHNVTATHTLPAGATFVSASTDHPATFSVFGTGSCSGTTTITCALGTLVVGEQAHITHVGRLNQAGPATSTASASASESDPTPANNTSSATVTVGTSPGGGGGGGGGGGTLPPPVATETGNFVPTGNVFIIGPNGTRIPLTDPRQLAFPVTIDASAPGARVTITVARVGGGTETATFYAGRFIIDQNLVATTARALAGSAQTRIALTELRLAGGNFAQCKAPARKGKGKKSRRLSSAEQRPSRPVRRLWGNGRGNFRTRGRYSSATVRGTIWLTQDQCNGTLTRVTQGSVLVNDFTRKRQQLVRAGKSYLAPATAPRRRR